ncbi:MFS transporter [Nocardiopsis composta]|uniref:Putative MFS family arabinose efflux permease n=1 Tax=Nocardiopsis composta TaxID=157465 RepID=A0A7W8VEU1_9ACTN|nr:MFS transporter [Nocardiopsis composta]MBB5433284.1 putative MFS family arabinose efflux permease [Nocardiopsis composta]
MSASRPEPGDGPAALHDQDGPARSPEPGGPPSPPGDASAPSPSDGAAAPAAEPPADGGIPGDLRMAADLWPVLLAGAVGLLPFTVFGNFLVPMAEDAGTGVAALGSLRGLGGLAALVVGVALAPLIDRLPKKRAAAGALAALAAAALLGTAGELLALGAFCLLVGAATAVLNPALTAQAADRYTSDAASGRAATLVTATQSMTAMLAAPLVALPAALWGWRGDLVAVAAVSVLLAAVLLLRPEGGAPPAPGERTGYLASFRRLAGVPGAVPLLLVGFLRTAAFMGYLAYLAAFYDDRFALSPTAFALVWTLSGASFFLGNLFTGRLANASARISAETLLIAGAACATAAIAGFYFTPWLPLALALTSLLGASHAVVAACVVTLLVRRCGPLRGSALSLNAAGQSLGVFAGAAAGGAGLALAGHPGTALVFGATTLAALLIAAPTAPRCRRPH